MRRLTRSGLPAATIWLTGLSGSGKTTLARGLEQEFAAAGIADVALLDGELVRAHLGTRYGHGIEDRYAVLRHIVRLAGEHNRANRIAIVATISHRRDMRTYARRHLDRFMEVYLRCPVGICAERDVKGHYRRAYAGEYDVFAGVTEPYELSPRPELTVDTARLDADRALAGLFQAAMSFLGEVAPGEVKPPA